MEPPVTLDSTLHGAGAEPLLKREVARLIEVRGEIIPRGEADQVTHQAEKGLEKTLEVSGVLPPKVGLSKEAVTELGKVRIPRAVNTHDSLQDVAEGAEVTIGGEDGVEFPQPKVGHDHGDEGPDGDGAHEVRIGGLRAVGGQRGGVNRQGTCSCEVHRLDAHPVVRVVEVTGAGESGTRKKPGEFTTSAGRKTALVLLAGSHATGVGEVVQETRQGGPYDMRRLPVVGRAGRAAKEVGYDGHPRTEADVVRVNA